MGKTTILVVEDEEIVAADIASQLGQLGYEIIGTLGRGEDAINLTRELRPNLVLMDIKLAGAMDGVEAAEIIRREFGLPVIFLTAHSDRATLERAKLTESFGYLLKPFDNHGLETQIEMALYKHKAEAEKQKLEARNRQLQKAESLGRMAGAIAHHFNNKLHAVRGYLELAIVKLPQGDNGLKNLTAAMQAADEAAEVSQSMLNYLGQVNDPQVPLDLTEICRKNLRNIEATKPKNVAFEPDLPFPGPTINANAKQTQLILSNLISNSLEAIGTKQGTIHLTVKMVASTDISPLHRLPLNRQPDDKPYACLEVRDTGCGIAAKDIEEAFDPFFSTKFTGRGLGLSVVLGLVQAHSGFVTVESTPDQGSAFRVFFPVSTEQIPSQPAKAVNASKISWTGTVLLVDDDYIVLEMISAIFSMIGFTVLQARDGIEAVEVFQQHRDEIRLVLTDFAMPRMNGLETLTALRQIDPGIPVIMASGYSEEQVMEGVHSELPQAFLGKPYGLQALRDAIHRILVETKK